VVIDAQEAIRLQQGLISGLLQRSNDLDLANAQLVTLSGALKEIQRRVRMAKLLAGKSRPEDVLNGIGELAQSAIEASEIDEADE
jgi:hypothetical protein